MTSPQDNPNRAIEQVREGTTTALTKGRAILDKGKETIASLEAANAELQNDIREAHLKGQALLQHARRQMEGLNNYFAPFLSESSKQLQELSSHLPLPMAAEWSVNAWQRWDVLPIPRLDLLRYGIMKESRAEGQLTLPAFVPFVGRNRSVIIRSSGNSVDAGRSLLQSLLIRSAFMLLHQASFLLLDPAGNGMAFPMRRFLPQVRPNSEDVRRDLDAVTSEIRRIIETFLDASVPSFELVPEDMRLNERYILVFAADFPHRYERRAIEALHSIATTGPKAGVYLFLHWNRDMELQRDLPMDLFRNAFYIDAETAQVTAPGNIAFTVTPDIAPSAQLQEQLFAKLRAATPVERRIDWDEVIGIPEENWWTVDSSSRIETPIGKRGRGDTFNLWFGEKDGRPVVHGVLGAMPGAGKSSLYHALVAGLAVRYSPEDLRLYLIDGKFGVEFQPYKRLPHAEVVSLKTIAELARSVLAELVEEMRRRNAIFSRHGVTSLVDYRGKGQPGGKLPRILLIVDEYQVLFEDDQNGVASNYLKQLSELGRSAGIHMLLASQRFGAVGMLNQQAIFANVHLRIAMQMAETTVRSLTEFGPRGRNLIVATCNLPGKMVVNDRAGEDSEGANVSGKAAFITGDRRDAILHVLSEKAQNLSEEQLPRRVVFNGEEQPDLIDNPQFFNLLQDERWLGVEELERFARQPLMEGGLNLPDWFAVEHPHVFWLGQEFNVRGQSTVVVRRRTSENMLVIGSYNNTIRYGMMAAALAGLAVSSSPNEIAFTVVDRSIAGAQWATVIQTACEEMLRPAGYAVEFTKDGKRVEDILTRLVAEMERRRGLDEEVRAKEPSLFVLMTDLDTVDAMRRKTGTFGSTDSPAGELLRRLYVDAAPLGIHLILSFTGLNTLGSVIDTRRDLQYFRHRVALQMSEDESFTVVRSRKASQLQPDPKPLVALYFDMENEQKAARFKPYSTEPSADSQNGSLEDQLWEIGARLSARKR